MIKLQQLTWKDLFSEDVPLHDYILTPSSENFLDVLEELKQSKVIAFDIETFGKESWMALYPWKGKIRSFQIGLSSGKVIIIDLGGWESQKDKSTKERIDELDDLTKETLQVLKEKLFAKDVNVLGANLLFDATFVRVHLGWVIRSCRDVMIMSQVLWGGVGAEKKGEVVICLLPHNFGAIAKRVGIDIKKGFGGSNWGWNLSNSQINYQAEDVYYLFPVYERLKSLIIQDGCIFSAYVECQAVTAFAEMQYQGFPIDLQLAQEFSDDRAKELVELENIWYSCFPGCNYASVDQVKASLNSILSEGNKIASVSKDTLNQIDMSLIREEYQEAILALKKIRKLLITKNYVDNIIANSFDGGTGRIAIRTFFKQIGPGGTGRTSASASIKNHTLAAQLQNPSKAIRHIFRHSNPDKILFTYDASSSHMRIASQYAANYWRAQGHSEDEIGEMLIVKLFREDYDGHSVFGVDIANRLFGKNWTAEEFMKRRKEVDAEGNPTPDSILVDFCREKGSKPGFYSCINGAGYVKNHRTLVTNGFNCTLEDAKYITSRLEYHHPGLLGFIKSSAKTINAPKIIFPFVDVNGNSMSNQEYGYVKCLSGRRQYFKKRPLQVYDKDRGGFVEGEYKRDRNGEIIKECNFTNAVAAHWLLVEADIMKDVTWQLQDIFFDNPEWGAVIFNMVHDEINGECNREYKQIVGETIRRVFRDCFSKWVKVIPVLDEKFEEDPCCGFMESWKEK